MPDDPCSRNDSEVELKSPQAKPIDHPSLAGKRRRLLVFCLAIWLGPWDASAEEWQLVGLEGLSLSSVAADPNNLELILAGPGPDAGVGIWVSMDGGSIWQLSTGGLPDPHRVNAIAFQPEAAHRSDGIVTHDILIGIRNFSGGPGIYRSSDLGLSWQPSISGLSGPPYEITALVFDPADSAVLFAGRNDPTGGVAKSIDGGGTWFDSSMGLGSDGICQDGCILDLAIDPSSPSVLYAAAPAHEDLYKTTSGGASWSPTMIGFSPERIAISPSVPTTLFATGSTFDFAGGLSRTVDGGDTWQDLSANPALPQLSTASHRSIVVDPNDSARVSLLLEDSGPQPADEAIWATLDGGENWFRANEGLESVEKVYDLAYQGSSLLAATSNGIYRLRLDIFADGFESGDLTAWVSPFAP